MRRLVRLGAVIAVVAVAAGAGWWVATSGVVAGAGDGTGSGADADGSCRRARDRNGRATDPHRDRGPRRARSATRASTRCRAASSGTLTWTVPVGTVVDDRRARSTRSTAANRASLMYGSRPAWRTLEPDVSERRRRPPARGEPAAPRLHAQGRRDRPPLGRRHDGGREALAAGPRPDGRRLDRAWRGGLPARGDPDHRDQGDDWKPASGRAAPCWRRPRIGASSALDLDARDRDLFEVGDGGVDRAAGRHHRRRYRRSRSAASPRLRSDGQGGTSTTLPVTITPRRPAAAGSDLDAAPVDGVGRDRDPRERADGARQRPGRAHRGRLRGGGRRRRQPQTRRRRRIPGWRPRRDPRPTSSGSSRACSTAGWSRSRATASRPGDLVVVPS